MQSRAGCRPIAWAYLAAWSLIAQGAWPAERAAAQLQAPQSPYPASAGNPFLPPTTDQHYPPPQAELTHSGSQLGVPQLAARPQYLHVPPAEAAAPAAAYDSQMAVTPQAAAVPYLAELPTRLPPAGTTMRAAFEPMPGEYAEPVITPLPSVLDDSSCCQPSDGCCSSWRRFIYHPPALGCGQFGCLRLWGDPNWEPDGFTLAGLARGYYLNDQRVEWTGLEATFGAEAALNPRYVQRVGNWLMRADGVFFLNQPFERNILIDPERRSYAANFYPDVFQIWQLNLGFTRGDFTVAVGKDRTPFGRYYFPIYSNSYFDAPFLRTEVIKWVETGVFVRWSPGPLNLEAAVTNGGVDRDTNSSKALVCRAGFDTPFWALGASAKIQDGTGSEHQKLNNSYYGFDAMARWGRFELSGEAVWDKYGFREAEMDPNDIFWGRSIYYREIFNGTKDGALHGFGYYVNLAWIYGRARIDLNYGEYYPQQIGNPLHDPIIARLMAQGSYEVMPGVQTFLVLMDENPRPVEEFRRGHNGFVLYTGVQWVF